MLKEYKLYPSKAKTVKANGLTSSAGVKYGREDVYYDFSLLDEVHFDYDYEREMIEHDLMTHHAMCWYDQPLPICIPWNNFTSYHGQLETSVSKVFKANGMRMLVIVEVTKVQITRDVRGSIYDRFLKTERTYEADNHHMRTIRDLELSV